MRIKTQHNRRSFLKASAAAGGGMLLGFNLFTACSPADAKEAVVIPQLEVPEEWYNFNTFIKIGENGVVTIMSPNPEIGQNVKTSMPMIVAEELDVDWNKVMVEQAGLDGGFTRQVAGGSQSIRQGWESLRMAGATARQMLITAAAAEWGVPAAEITAVKGELAHAASGQTAGYGDFASKAAGMEIPEEVSLKDAADFSIIGHSTKNVDGLAIATGKPLFGLDYSQEGMQIAMLAHAPKFGQKIKSIDDAAAKAVPGVTGVYRISTETALKDMRNLFAFQDLVAVVGKDTWSVMMGKRALTVEWEEDEKVESSADHDRALTEALEKPDKAKRKDGNPEKAFAEADRIIEQTYSAPFLAHNTMEPMNFFAHVTEDKATLAGPIQTPAWMHGMVADGLGIPKENISIMMTRQGGGFGRRLYGHFGLEAALISQQAQTPIKLIYSREDDMTYGVYRPAYKVTYKAALSDKNILTAFEVNGAGIHGGPVFPDRFPAGTIENYAAHDTSVDSNVSTGAWRAPRSNFIAGAEQSFLDEIAEAIGIDPIELRLDLLDRAVEDPIGENNDYDPLRLAGVLKLVRDKSGWGEETPNVYRGVAAYFCHNSYVAQVVDLVLEDESPRVKKVWCAVDCGIVVNPDAARNQVEGGIVDGIGHAMYSGMTFTDGKPNQRNFNRYNLIRHDQAPMEIETFFVDNGIDPTGLGEPSLPPIMGALANAIYKATGERQYHQPFAEAKVRLSPDKI